MVRLTKASKPKGSTDDSRFGILNPWGDVWTSRTFKSEGKARKYIEDYWRGIDDAGDLTQFKVVPVRVHVSVLPRALLAAEQRGEEKKAAEIEALLKGPVAVRGLEWEGKEAETILGTYKVKIDNNGDWRCFRNGWTLYASPKVPAIFGSEVLAKAAAQADYERRIISCLEASPAPVTYPRLTKVRAHKHTCANVQIGSTHANKCDCGALDTAGNAIEVASPAPVSEEMVERLFQSIAPFIEGTAWREVRAAITAALGGQKREQPK